MNHSDYKHYYLQRETIIRAVSCWFLFFTSKTLNREVKKRCGGRQPLGTRTSNEYALNNELHSNDGLVFHSISCIIPGYVWKIVAVVKTKRVQISSRRVYHWVYLVWVKSGFPFKDAVLTFRDVCLSIEINLIGCHARIYSFLNEIFIIKRRRGSSALHRGASSFEKANSIFC